MPGPSQGQLCLPAPSYPWGAASPSLRGSLLPQMAKKAARKRRHIQKEDVSPG